MKNNLKIKDAKYYHNIAEFKYDYVLNQCLSNIMGMIEERSSRGVKFLWFDPRCSDFERKVGLEPNDPAVGRLSDDITEILQSKGFTVHHMGGRINQITW